MKTIKDKCTIIIIPTTKETPILNGKALTREISTGKLFFTTQETIDSNEINKGKYEFVHAYVLSDEEIKEGNWWVNLSMFSSGLMEFMKPFNDWDKFSKERFSENKEVFKKIIATTNPDLKVCQCGSIPHKMSCKAQISLPRMLNEFFMLWVDNPENEILVEHERFYKDLAGEEYPLDDFLLNSTEGHFYRSREFRKVKVSEKYNTIECSFVVERTFTMAELINFGKKCFYKGFDKAVNDDANCFTAWREEFAGLIEPLQN